MYQLEVAISRPQGVSGPLLDLVARRIRAEADAELSRFGFRPLHLVTMTLLDVSGEHAQSDLAEYLRIDRNTMASLLIELEVKDLIERRLDRQDRRRHTVSLTAAGELCLYELREKLADAERRMLAPLNSQEQSALYRLLEPDLRDGQRLTPPGRT